MTNWIVKKEMAECKTMHYTYLLPTKQKQRRKKDRKREGGGGGGWILYRAAKNPASFVMGHIVE